MKFRVKVLLDDGGNHTEPTEADNPVQAQAQVMTAMRKRGIAVSKVLTVKKWRGEDEYIPPSAADASKLFGGNVRRVTRQEKRMRNVPVAKLKEIFGDNIPAHALELLSHADDTVSDAELIAALQLMHDARVDKRVARALEIGKKVYATPGKTLEETYGPADSERLLVVLAKVFVEVFKDLDLQTQKSDSDVSLPDFVNKRF